MERSTNADFPSLCDGNRVIKMILKKDLPYFLTVFGFECRLWYRDQPIQCFLCSEHGPRAQACPLSGRCRRCHQPGHVARECSQAWVSVSRVAADPVLESVDPWSVSESASVPLVDPEALPSVDKPPVAVDPVDVSNASSETQGQLVGAGKRLNGRGKKLGEEKSRKKVGAPGILLLTDQFRNHLKSLPVIGHKNIFCAQSQARILNGFGTGRLREESQGLLLSFLTFLRPIFSLARLAFFPPPLTAPGSPRMCRTLLLTSLPFQNLLLLKRFLLRMMLHQALLTLRF